MDELASLNPLNRQTKFTSLTPICFLSAAAAGAPAPPPPPHV